MATEEDHRRLGQEVAEYFTYNPNINFVGFAGLGRHGGALIMEEKVGPDQAVRKLVVKYSLGSLSSDEDSDSDDQLRNEYRWLEMLRGAEHIVQLVPFADCSLNLPGISNGESTYQSSLRRAERSYQALDSQEDINADGNIITREPLRVRRCPTFALEHLPNGTFHAVLDKLWMQQALIPNRMLWRIWLCLVRQCVAMAFPPNIPPQSYNGQIERERIDPDREYYTLTQNSSHIDNFLFGSQSSWSPDIDHDPGVPVVKLIDFGRGRADNAIDYVRAGLPNPFEFGSRTNLWGAASVMMYLCLPYEDDDRLEQLEEPVLYEYMGRYRSVEILTVAPQPLREARIIDIRLRDQLVRCLAAEMSDRPSLRQALDAAETEVNNRSPQDNSEFQNWMEMSESDETIRDFVQRLFYDADA
ncbi:hypothetical protein GGS24DRAFT_487448 [Hypoxylon argillaceum]|nr:hypothetical protein GGS24DRAFT_487448 [Hypoxylon argillaceum]